MHELLYSLMRQCLSERLWKTVKYERAYIHAYDTKSDARRSIMEYIDWYNKEHPHSRLGRKIPDEVYAERMP